MLYWAAFAYLYTVHYAPQFLLADHIIAPHDDTVFKKYFGGFKTRPIKTGVSLDLFTPKLQPRQNKRLLYVGRFAAEKNILHMLDLFRKHNTGYSITLIGKGPQKEIIEAYVREHGLGQVLDHVPHHELAGVYQAHAVTITSSLSETYGFTLLESLACGTPVVYPDCGVFRALYHEPFPECCYDVDDPEQFWRAVRCAEAVAPERCVEYAQRHTHHESTRHIVENYYT
jgi:glycosyltransferase involved in cell wall biosynthesis